MIGFLLLSAAFAQTTSNVFTQDDDGRVMYNNGYVCDDGFGSDEADMVCKEMDFTGGADEYETSATLDINPSTVYYTLDDLSCNSGATSLSGCTYQTLWNNCVSNEAVKVCCAGQTHSWDCDGVGKVSAGGVIFGLLCCCCCYCVIPGVIIFMCIRGNQAANQNRYNQNQINQQQNNTYAQPPATQMAVGSTPAPTTYSQAPTGQQPYVATQQANYAAPPPASYNAGPPQAYNQPPQAYNNAPPSYNQPPANDAPPSYGGPPPAY